MSVPVARRGWDFTLTVITVVLLGGVGLQSFLGTVYVWWAQRSTPGWDQGPGYQSFIATMNSIAAPQIVLLVIVMGLCVPKRLFSRVGLMAVSAGMLVAGLAVGALTRSMATGLAAYLALAGLIQVAVVVMTVAGIRGPSYMTEGRLTKTGSGLLHLGFIVFAFVVVALQNSTFMLPVFWVATVFTVLGCLLSFYADAFAVKRFTRLDPEALSDPETPSE
ncbi:MAG: hypothetical protein Q8K89_01165 [Actinomycetota bacterium]|nr:hypothetical protein [Actinomycetota bacterium]